MSENEDSDRHGTKDDLYQLFGALREHVVEVVDEFAERVSERIDQLSDPRFEERPSLLGMLFSAVVQAVNIVGPSDERPPEETEDDEHR